MERLESEDEKYLTAAIEQRGGRCYKVEIKGRKGYPDRSVFCYGLSYLVELKRGVGGVVSEHQKRVHREIADTGCDVFILTGRMGVEAFLRYVDFEKSFSDNFEKSFSDGPGEVLSWPL